MQEYDLPKAVVAVPGSADDCVSETLQAKGFTVRGIAVTPDIEEPGLQALATQLEGSWNETIATKRNASR